MRLLGQCGSDSETEQSLRRAWDDRMPTSRRLHAPLLSRLFRSRSLPLQLLGAGPGGAAQPAAAEQHSRRSPGAGGETRPAAWLGAVALGVPLILHQCIVARPSGQAERGEQPFHISCIQCHANTIPAPQPEGWKLRRWQYERLIEVVRPDAAR